MSTFRRVLRGAGLYATATDTAGKAIGATTL